MLKYLSDILMVFEMQGLFVLLDCVTGEYITYESFDNAENKIESENKILNACNHDANVNEFLSRCKSHCPTTNYEEIQLNWLLYFSRKERYCNFLQMLMSFVEKHVSLTKKRREPYSIIDVGCGSGNDLFQINNFYKRKNLQFLGIDKSITNIHFAHSNYCSKNIQFKYHDINEQNLDQQFDVVLCKLVFQHQVTPKQFISSLCGLLKPQGLLIIYDAIDLSVYSPDRPACFMNLVKAYQSYKMRYGTSVDNVKKLTRFLLDAGLTLERIQCLPRAYHLGGNLPLDFKIELIIDELYQYIVISNLLKKQKLINEKEYFDAVHEFIEYSKMGYFCCTNRLLAIAKKTGT